MARAIWNGTVIAESDTFEEVEGNVYFPPSAIRKDHFEPSTRTSVCPWKGTASYYDVVVGGERNPAAAWFYPDTKAEAKHIEGFVAFWNGVQVER
ncbi:MAG: DUF427 domain-containing protein [Sandaracinaceae bacterium]